MCRFHGCYHGRCPCSRLTAGCGWQWLRETDRMEATVAEKDRPSMLADFPSTSYISSVRGISLLRQWRIQGFLVVRKPPPHPQPGNNMITWKIPEGMPRHLHLQLLDPPPSSYQSWPRPCALHKSKRRR